MPDYLFSIQLFYINKILVNIYLRLNCTVLETNDSIRGHSTSSFKSLKRFNTVMVHIVLSFM